MQASFGRRGIIEAPFDFQFHTDGTYPLQTVENLLLWLIKRNESIQVVSRMAQFQLVNW